MFKILLTLLVISLVKQPCRAQDVIKTILVATTTEKEDGFTDLPEEDVDEALNHDVGKYTTMSFQFYNRQLEKLSIDDICTDHFIKCTLTQGVVTPVCAYNTPYEKADGFFTFNSYCDVYFENCKRQMRFWRILDTGGCNPNIRYYYLPPEVKET